MRLRTRLHRLRTARLCHAAHAPFATPSIAPAAVAIASAAVAIATASPTAVSAAISPCATSARAAVQLWRF